MEDGQGLSATWSANSDPPHRCREGGDLPFTKGQESPRDVFRQELSHPNGPNFLRGSTSCWSYVTLSSGMSVVASCASTNERIHSSSSNCFEVGSFSFFRNINCVMSRKRHSSARAPVPRRVRSTGLMSDGAHGSRQTVAHECSWSHWRKAGTSGRHCLLRRSWTMEAPVSRT